MMCGVPPPPPVSRVKVATCLPVQFTELEVVLAISKLCQPGKQGFTIRLYAVGEQSVCQRSFTPLA